MPLPPGTWNGLSFEHTVNLNYEYASDKATSLSSWEPAGTTCGTASLHGITQPPHADSNTAIVAPWCWSHEQEMFMYDASAGCENIYASRGNKDNYDCELLNIFKLQSELAVQLGHQPKDMVMGGAPTCYYLNGALGCECNGNQPTRDDILSDFYPEPWELSPKYMESMFNDFYFDKTVDSLNLMTLQASTKQLDVILIPLNGGSVIESKTDLGNNPYWTTYLYIWFEQRNRGLRKN